ncbi:MAG: serine/threonine-protein kinase, partial [Gemmatimonadaceae bacterium]
MSDSSASPRSDLLLAIRVFAGSRFEVLGELGADGRGDLLYLARERGGEAGDQAASAGRLVGLRVEAPERARRDDRTVALAIENDLDALVGATPRCARCAVPVAVAGATLCRSCTVNPLSGELVRERPAAPLEIQELLDLYRLDGWVPEGSARTAPDGTPFHYVRDATATRALLLFLRAEHPQAGVMLFRPCLAPAFADDTPLDTLPHVPSAADTLGAIPRTDPTGTAADAERGVSAGAPAAAADAPAADESTAGRTCPQCGSHYAGDMMFCPRDGTALRVARTTSSLVGSIIAERYHVLDVLGEGGMGRVYLAEHVKIRRRCALKVMSEQLSRDVDAVGRFVREAENAARVAHPNVAAVYDFGETPDGQAYLAMELVDGESLSEVLRVNGGLLPPPRAAEVARQVALGLAAAHELGIVHRDLKPDNVMVTRGRDGRDLVKVVDFGIAKAEHAEGQQITRTGLVIGTPEYMSPEQLLGEPLDGRSDLYSLGCILYRMLTGRAPFATGGGEAVLARLTVAPEPPSAVEPRLTPAFDAVTMLALAAQPERRVQSAQALAGMLAPLAADGPATTDAPSTAPDAIPSATASRSPTGAAGATGATGATGAAGAAGATGAPPPVTAERAAAGAGGRWRAVAAAAVLALVGAGGWAVLGRGGDAARGAASDVPTAAAASDSTGTAAGASAAVAVGVAGEPASGDAGPATVTPLRGPALAATERVDGAPPARPAPTVKAGDVGSTAAPR